VTEISPEGLFDRVERDTTDYRFDRRNMLLKIADAYESSGDHESAEKLRTESAAFTLCTRGDAFPGYFQPFVVMTDGTTAPPRTFFNAARLEHLADRARTSSNPIHASRYADVVWDFSEKKGVRMAQIAADAYVKCAELYRGNAWGIEFGEALSRSLSLSLMIRDSVRVSAIKQTIIGYLKDLDSRQEYRFCLELAHIIADSRLAKTETEINLVLDILSKGATYYREKHPSRQGSFGPAEGPSEHLVREFHRARVELTTNQTYAEAERVAIAESYERQGDSTMETNALASLAMYLDAEREFQNLGRRIDIDRLRVKLSNAGRLTEKGMHAVSAKIEIRDSEIEQFVKPLLAPTLKETLERVSATSCFVPNLTSTKERVGKLREEFPLAFLFPRIDVRDGHVITSSSEETELADVALTDELVRGIQLSTIFIRYLFEKLRKDYALSSTSIQDHFREWGLCANRNLELLDIGTRHYFDEDYVSAMHILVLQFEDVLRNILQRAGRPVTHSGGAIVLSSLLSDEVFGRVAGPNLKRYYQVLLSEPSGMNLRNILAHGLMEAKDMNRATVELVLYALLTLTRFRLQPGTRADSAEP
jgi:hypothetical protein